MEGSNFEPVAFFGAIAASGVRAVLIGRRAMIVLGLPVLTADFDFWLHIDDVERMNAAVAPFDLRPDRLPAQARAAGRYVIENDEHVDVLVAREVPTVDGVRVRFDDVWARRREVEIAAGIVAALPCLDDLILTKRFGSRPKDAEDVRLLELLRGEGGGE